jgi:hypothetical protein
MILYMQLSSFEPSYDINVMSVLHQSWQSLVRWDIVWNFHRGAIKEGGIMQLSEFVPDPGLLSVKENICYNYSYYV